MASVSPTNTSLSPACRRSVGATAVMIEPRRSISARKVRPRLRRPASSIDLPTSALSEATATSKVNARRSANCSEALMRTGSSQFAVSRTKRKPTPANTSPTGVTSKSSKPSAPVSMRYWPSTTRLVLVPMSVSVPPRIDA